MKTRSLISVCGAGIACFAFCMFFGGCLKCAAAAFASGALLYAAAPYVPRPFRLFAVAAACAFAARVSGLCAAFVLGTAMPFVPGLALCNGLYGLLRAKKGAAKTVLRSLCGAFAMAAGHALFVPPVSSFPPPCLFWGAAGAFGFALMLGVPRPFRGALCAFLCSAACLFTGTFVAMFAAYSACFLLKSPSLAKTAAVPLVPGGGLIVAFAALMRGSFALFSGMLLLSAYAFSCIALARLCAHLVFFAAGAGRAARKACRARGALL